jgi:hypothetical protein
MNGLAVAWRGVTKLNVVALLAMTIPPERDVL